MLLPPSLEEMIDINHPVRVVNRVIEQIEIDPVIEKYKGGHIELSSADVAEGCCFCLLNEYLFFT